jgi:hypothetical protein
MQTIFDILEFDNIDQILLIPGPLRIQKLVLFYKRSP